MSFSFPPAPDSSRPASGVPGPGPEPVRRPARRPARTLGLVAVTAALVVTSGVAAEAQAVAATTTAVPLAQNLVSSTARTTTARALPAGAKVRVVATSWKKNAVVATSTTASGSTTGGTTGGTPASTPTSTVGTVLAAQKVTPDADDQVLLGPAAAADRAAGAVATVTVKRVAVAKKTTRTKVRYRTVVKKDAKRYKTLSTVVKRKGKNGVKTVVKRVTTVDGAVTATKTLSTKSTVVNKVVVKGTKKAPKRATVAYSRAVGKDMVARRGWSSTQYQCLVSLWNRESGWRVSAYNRSSGATGIPQALPGRKMASKGSDWRTNPKTQIAWGLAYVKGRYGTPCRALAHSHRTGWY